MTLFWLAVAGMLLGVAGFLFWPIVVAQEQFVKFAGDQPKLVNTKKNHSTQTNVTTSVAEVTSHKQRNIEIFKERLSELQAELAQGTLDSASFGQLKLELEKSLLNDVAIDLRPVAKPTPITAKHWFIGTLMTLAVAVCSIGLYLALGRHDDYVARLARQAQGTLKPLDEGQDRQVASNANPKAPDLMKAIDSLKTKLKADPKNVKLWFLLANSYAVTNQYQNAADTFLAMEKIVSKDSPEYATVKGSYAQSLYLLHNEKMTDGVEIAIAEALKVDPKEPSALTLKGVESYEQEAYKQAIGYWEQAKIKANPQLVAQFINPAISAAQAKLGIVPSSVPAPPPSNAPALHLVIDISPALKAKVSPGQMIFIFAKAQGGKMPLAVERLTVKDLPANVVLDDSKAAMPTAALSSAEIVDVTARVSISGGPTAQPGDLYASQEKIIVKQADNPIRLMINRVMP